MLATLGLFDLSLTMPQYVYGVCFLAGMVLLGLDLLSGTLSGGMALDLDLDMDANADLDLDLGGGGIGDLLLPLQPMCILTLVTIFGAVGTMLSTVFKTGLPEVVIGGIGAVTGYGIAVALKQFVLKPLKRNRAEALRAKSLIGHTAEVTVRIRPGSVGEVSVKTEQGLLLNYPARLYDEDGMVLEAGTTVGILGISPDKAMVYVIGLDMEKWLERMKGNNL